MVTTMINTLSHLECKNMTARIERMNNEDAKSSCLGDPRPSHQEQKPQKSHLEFERIGDLGFTIKPPCC